MIPINTATTNTSNFLVSNVVGQKALPQTVNVNINDISSTLLSAPGESGRGPELVSPSTETNRPSADALKAYLMQHIENPEFFRDLGTVGEKLDVEIKEALLDKSKEQSEKGKALDISGMSSSAVAVLVAINGFLLSLNNSHSALSSKLSLVSFEAAKNTAASMVREGINQLSGSISQSVLQVGITAVGAKQEHKGLSNERGALKNNSAKLDTLKAESRQIKNTLNSQNTTKLGSQPDGLSKLETRPNQVNIRSAQQADVEVGESVNLQTSNERLSPEHQSVLARRLDDIETDMDIQSRAYEDNRIKARDKQLLGDTIMKSSQSVSTLAGSSAQQAATVERSEQQISQASNRVATAASEDARESARGDANLIQEVLRMLDSINQSKNATMGVIAGNIRA